MNVQEIAVYTLFAVAIGYFGWRFYVRNFRKKRVEASGGKMCSDGGCGCS